MGFTEKQRSLYRKKNRIYQTPAKNKISFVFTLSEWSKRVLQWRVASDNEVGSFKNILTVERALTRKHNLLVRKNSNNKNVKTMSSNDTRRVFERRGEELMRFIFLSASLYPLSACDSASDSSDSNSVITTQYFDANRAWWSVAPWRVCIIMYMRTRVADRSDRPPELQTDTRIRSFF